MTRCQPLSARLQRGHSSEQQAAGLPYRRGIFCAAHAAAIVCAETIYSGAQADHAAAPGDTLAVAVRASRDLDIAVTAAGYAAVQYGCLIAALPLSAGDTPYLWEIMRDMQAAVEDLRRMQIRAQQTLIDRLYSQLTIEAAVAAHKERT